MTERPDGIPAEATWDPDAEGWELAAADEQGRKHGPVTCWRPDGSLFERCEYRHGVLHGPYAHYRPSGEVSQSGSFTDGKAHGVVTCYRSATAADDPMFLGAADAIVRRELDMERGLQGSFRSYDRAGNELGANGEPAPSRPPGVDRRAFFTAEGLWHYGLSDMTKGEDAKVGLSRWWQPDGTLVRLEYHRDKHTAVADRGPDRESKGNPLIEAAMAGDAAAADICLAAGFGAVPGVRLHAAYAGLPSLTLALWLGAGQPAAGQGAVPGSADAGSPSWPARPEPERPSNVDPAAVWVPDIGSKGGWVAGELAAGTAAAAGSWRAWEPPLLSEDEDDLASWEQVDYVAGRRTVLRVYAGYRFGSSRDLTGLAHQDGFPLRRELHFDTRGGVRLTRKFDGGELEKEVDQRDDGTEAVRTYHTWYQLSGGLHRERVTRGDELVTETWYAPDGTKSAEVTPAAELIADDDGTELQAERWRCLDGGRVIAEGLVPSGGGEPVGPWRLIGAAGEPYAEVEFTALTDSSLGMSVSYRLGHIAVALHAWEQAPWPPELDGVHDIDWPELDTYFGSARHFPFLLKGLAQPDPLSVEVAIGQLTDPILHQGTIEEATGPVVRYLVALAPVLASDAERAELLQLTIDVATRNGGLGAAFQIKQLYRHAGLQSPEEFFAEHGTEPAYYEVYQRITAAAPAWAELAASADVKIRHLALVLLAVAVADDAADALRERITAEPELELRGEAVLGLTLHGDTQPTRDLLAALIADAPAEPLTAFCAALTWLRLRAEPAETTAAAVGVILGALRGDLDTDDFESLYFGSGSADTDATTAIALLPAEQAAGHLTRLCAALEEVGPLNAIAVASALLDIVFPQGYQGGELTGPEHQVLAAIAASNMAWSFNVNLAEVLRNNGLPTSREKLRDLVGATPADPAGPSEQVTQ